MPTTKATKEAAQELGVSVGTLRNWSGQFAPFLSESARPGYKPERRFTDLDMVKLTYIKQLRSEGRQEEQILKRLAETEFKVGEVLAPTSDNKPQQTAIDAPSIVSEALQKPTEAATMPLAMLEHYQALEKRLDERLTTIEANNRSWVQGLAVGFIGAALFFLILVYLVSIYAK